MLSRRVYRRADLARLLDPQSVAVVGASASGRGFGAQTLLNLASFTGRVYAIHPQAQQIGEVKCYPSIAALPEVPDCVVIGVPREGVEAVVRDCAAAGVGGAVAETVGRLMQLLGQDRQVLAVTHLPQVAACADHHLVVAKQLTGGATLSSVSPVQGEKRVGEVARMLGGERLSDTTLAHAREMLQARA